MNKKVRVRFAPSPTGPLHMGGVRTALFNYLFAKQHGGDFLLRIEDTDSHRFVPGAEDYIIESLKWCGIQIDEGVSVGGPHAPYRQSERKDLYVNYVQQLLNDGKAYYAFDTTEVLASRREEMKTNGETFIYNYSTRNKLDNSLNMTKEELNKRLSSGEQYVVRFLIQPDQVIECNDMIRGKVSVNSSVLDDKVLWKSSDQLPTYHLANIVDDHLMEISHVIRGEEWLPSMPLHVLLYKAFDWEAPEFAHLSLILKPDGKGKLSKRDGVAGGFPVFPLEWKDHESGDVYAGYKESGYLPEAFINTISLLGWNPGSNDEIFSMEDLIKLFSIERVIKTGARFNPDKTKWFNSQWIKKSDPKYILSFIQESQISSLKEYFTDILKQKDDKRLIHTIDKVKGKVKLITEIPGLVIKNVATENHINYDLSEYSETDKKLSLEVLLIAINVDSDNCTQVVYDFCKEKELNFKTITTIIRYIITGSKEGLSIGDIIYINKEVIRDRLPMYQKELS